MYAVTLRQRARVLTMTNAILSYKNHHLGVHAQVRDKGYLAHLEITCDTSGITYRRWWPVPHPAPPAVYATSEEAEDAAMAFGRSWIDGSREPGPLLRTPSPG